MKMRKASLLVMICFILLVGSGFFLNLRIYIEPLSDFISHPLAVTGFKENMASAFDSDQLAFKEELINLNGLYAKVTMRRLFQNTLRMENGMLTSRWANLHFTQAQEARLINSLTGFDQIVSSYGGKFVYIQYPAKYDMQGDLMPEGMNSTFPKATEALLQKFRNAGIDVVDTLPLVTATVSDIEANFYRTDYHWKPTGVLKAFQLIMEHLNEIDENAGDSGHITDPDNWTRYQMPNHFLGAFGREVGKLYSGLDTLEWYLPNFETALSFSVPSEQIFNSGDFYEAFMREDAIGNGESVKEDRSYFYYLGDLYPLSLSRNLHAVSDSRVLVIQDSYDVPMIPCLSAVFRSVDAIDPRFYTEHSLNEYVSQTRPDIVIMAISGMVFSNEYYFEFSNGNDVLLSDERELLKEESVTVSGNDDPENHAVFYDRLEDQKYYTLSVPSVKVSGNNAEGISVLLSDPASKTIVSQTILDTAYCSKYGDCEWTFRTPSSGSGSLELQIYAGIAGNSENISLELESVRLYEREGILPFTD